MASKEGLMEDGWNPWRNSAITGMAVLLVLLFFSSCQKEEKIAAANPRPVRTITVEQQNRGEKVSLTGEIQPRYQADLGFRVNGKILERPVDVGTEVKKGDLLARLDPQRLRPIVLTAAAASLGMIPIASEVFWGPMAYAIIGGLFVATLLTLLFLPALYVAWFRIKEPAREQRGPVEEPAPAVAI